MNEELIERIDVLDDICNEKIAAFDKDWFGTGKNNCPPEDCMKNYQEYCDKREAACGDSLVELKKLELQLRMTKEPILSDIPDYGDVMSLSDFIGSCESGGFINSDGFGRYVKDGKETDIEIYPSDVKNGNLREEFTTIVWYNK